mgnify:CR=1 FL=1
MEPSKKNTPGPLVIASVVIIVLMIIFYFIITMFFPDLFQGLNTGEVQPVK